MKKTVRINACNGRYVDIDPNKLQREALDLIQYIKQNYSASNDKYDVIGCFLPLCEKAVNKQITEAIPVSSLPLQYERKERLFPKELNTLMARFCVTITGTPLEEVIIQNIDGKPYAVVEFE
tara:strand:+ start:382 stop:747 length:366 start_codon:yes stop_codon:yes gene_type:complete